jgi:ElaB/YqjD/DUF883 family membrane-anchored ribosome-binding protein
MTQPNDYPRSAGVDPVPYPAETPLGGQRPLTTEGEQHSTTEVAKDQASQVGGTAVDAGKHVANVAGEQAGQVASEATHQVKHLVSQTRSELTEQAASQQQRVAGGLRSLGRELEAMAQGSENRGIATDLVAQASERTNAVASWLEQREPGHVVDEVTRFARQRPGAFLALAAGAGLLVGRLGRGLKAATDDSGGGSATAPANGLNAGTPRETYPAAPEFAAPTYPPMPGYDPSPAPQGPNYATPPAPTYPPQGAPGYAEGTSGRDLAP